MESCWQIGCILCRFLLTLALLTIITCDAFRLRDLKNTVQLIPLKRVTPEGGFRYLSGTNSHFDKELKELHEFRVRRSTEGSLRVHNHTKITEEFELAGDNHTVAFLHWAGKNSPVIYIYTCGKVNQTESENIICEDAYFWRSTDYGSTFHREDHKFGNSKVINNVDFCLSNHRKVIVSVLKPKPTLYISEDEGHTFRSVPVNFSPHVISCNPVSDNLIVAHDQDAKKAYYFNDGGTRWTQLSDKVLRHYWGSHHVEGWGRVLFLEVQGSSKYSSVLKYAKLPCDSGSVSVQVFDKTLGEFMSHTLEVEGKYVFVQKDLKFRGLYVFYQNSSNSSTNFFQLAQFPLGLEEKSYKVVDASENEMMVVVRHETNDDQTYYNLYVSDVTGVKYSLSLENILSDRAEIWGQNTTLVDFHRVKGLNGTYLANVYLKDSSSGAPKFKSVISFNKGGEWFPLKAPIFDHNGNPTKCHPPQCSLHIHMVLSHWYYYISNVLSSDSAVGIIVAQGNLGSTLGETGIGVFLSNDGGVTWTKEFDSFHDFVIGDHGGIIAAVPMRRRVDKVWYSCTEGKAWSNVSVGSKPVVVYGMVTEPGETTLIVNLFGQYASMSFQWLSVKVNFTSVLDQKCQAGNYTYWSPNDERADGQCLLGQHIVFERRKSGDCCFNGDEYEREINITTCLCEMDDFDCDFGYKHDYGLFGDVCVATSFATPVPTICPEGRTYQHTRGYRKVIGDLCKGGVEGKLMPETRPCPTKAPGELNIKFAAVSKTVGVHKQVNFSLSQKEGSTESTWYAWDFGDNSTVLNKTGLSNAEHVSHTYHKHGDFVVRLTAANKAGQSMVTAEIIVKDPITAIDVDPPHAVVIGQEAWFNVTLHSNNLVNPEEYSPSYGFVHFMWIFEKDKDEKKKPLLTWDHEVSHTFTTPGKRDVSVTAISVIGQGSAHVSVTVYEDLTTVRLSFDLAVEEENDNTKGWREYFSQRLQAALSQELDVKPSRLEVVVLRGKPTRSDVSITPAPTNTSKTRTEIVDQLKKLVYEGTVKIQIHKDTTIRVINVEVLPDRDTPKTPRSGCPSVSTELKQTPTTTPSRTPSNTSVNEQHSGSARFDGGSSPTSSSNSGSGTRLAIGVGIAASLVVIALIVTLLYFLRRYNLLRSRYTHLRLYSDGAQLRDPLIEDDTEDEQSLHPQPGGSLRYVPVATSAVPDPDSDEELIDNFNGGSLALMPASQNGQAQGNNVHV